MSLKIAFALVCAVALCWAQTDAPSSSGIPAKEAPAPIIPPTANPPETTQNPPVQITPAPAAPTAPASQPAPADQPPPPGKAVAGGRFAGAKPETGHRGYVIGPLDVLNIKVWKDANLTGMVSVDSDGMISMPLIGGIKADGLTPGQLKDKIAERLRDFFNNNPDVDVTVLKVNSKRYYVYGGVGRAGEYPLVQETTIMDALSSVGGFKDFANKKKIYILRGTTKIYFNYKDVSQGKHPEQNIRIENGDRIFVPE